MWQEIVNNREQSGASPEWVLRARTGLEQAALLASSSAAASLERTRQLAEDAVLSRGPESPITWSARGAYASALRFAGRWYEALDVVDRTIEAALAVASPEGDGLIRLRRQRTTLLVYAGRYAEASAEAASVLAASRAARWDELALSWASHLTVWHRLGRYSDVLAAMEALDRPTDRPWHLRSTLRALLDMTRGMARRELGELAAAEADLMGAWQVHVAKYGPEGRSTLESRDEIARLRIRQGRLAEAATLAEESLATAERLRERDVYQTMIATERLVEVRLAAGRFQDAVTVATQLMPSMLEYFGPVHPETLVVRFLFARARGALGEDVAAEHRAVYEARRVALGAEHPLTLESWAACRQ